MSLDQEEIIRRRSWTNGIDDRRSTLAQVYGIHDTPGSIERPYYDPSKIVFDMSRSFPHMWTERTSDLPYVWEDLEYFQPIWHFPDEYDALRKLSHQEYHNYGPHNNQELGYQKPWPYRKGDMILKSSISTTDHLYPCEHIFNSWHLANTLATNIDIFIEQPTKRPYFANILLGTTKPHRSRFFQLLSDNKQLENNIISYFHHYRSPFLEESDAPSDITITKAINDAAPGERVFTCIDVIGTDYRNFASQLLSKHVEENSWISVVAETNDNNNCFFPTEKIGKALLSGKPFIVLSGKFYLRHLKEIGFRTFHPVIDESYDKVEDWKQRMTAAFNSFMKLKELDQNEVREQLGSILEYNENHMRNLRWLGRTARRKIETLASPMPEGYGNE